MSKLFIADIETQLGYEYPDTTPMKFNGFDGSIERHVRSLKAYLQRVERMLAQYPRKPDETPKDWCDRVRSDGSGEARDRTQALGMVGRLHSIIERMKDELELERRRHADARKAEQKAETATLRRQASIDAAEVAKLEATIAEASKHEQLLASVFAAFKAHNDAQAARRRLATIFDSAESARAQLGEKLPKRPRIADAPIGAIEFAKQIQRVIALHPDRR
jgi:hypothetical protein